MRRAFLAIVLILTSWCCQAQEKIPFPFQGGINIMERFFKDSLTVSPEIIQKKATGTAIFKFTADDKGGINKIIIYYADDAILIPPLITALKKSNHKWVIPDNEKMHDFIIQFSVYFNPPATDNAAVMSDFYKFYTQRKPLLSLNQIPIDDATLLPTVVVSYDLQ